MAGEIRKLRGRPRRRDMRDALVLLYVNHCADAAAGKIELLSFDRWVETIARSSRLLQRQEQKTLTERRRFMAAAGRR